jgi:N-acetylglucosaminyldiphosphoundecaprenol N-acetyl-beta-D-mannosaminyltransferase
MALRWDISVDGSARTDRTLDSGSWVGTGPANQLPHRHIVGMRVDATTYGDTVDRVIQWSRSGESRYVCVASVNNVILSHRDSEFRQAMNDADLVTPDGMPLVWGLRLLGVPEAQRVCGAALTPLLCDAAAREGIPVGFYGGSPEVLKALLTYVGQRFPDLHVAYSWSPPYRSLTVSEVRRVIADIDGSGARLMFVGLGAPKQERWMADEHAGLHCTMVGVGAAFDLLAGRVTRAPGWMQRAGMEWCYRLIQEPRRLWKRYLIGNTEFAAMFATQLLQTKVRRLERTTR